MKNEMDLFNELMGNLNKGKDVSATLAMITGDVEFKMIQMLISTMEAIIINNDLAEFVDFITPFLLAKAEEEEAREKAMENQKPTATDDLLNKFTQNGRNGIGLN